MNCKKKITMDIRKRLEEGFFRTDSDIEDYAEEWGIPTDQVEKTIFKIRSENTPCQGCKYVVFMYSGMYPCNSCCRRARDMYDAEE